MDGVGARSGAFPSEETQRGWSLWRAPLIGTLEYILRKAPDRTSVFIGAPLRPRGT